jgi:3-hydroxyacyl-CoA dehydrogenase
MPAPQDNDLTLMEELVASNKRIEALLVALVEAQSSNMPPGWQRRFGGPIASEAVTMALEGATPAEVAEHMRDKGGRP